MLNLTRWLVVWACQTKFPNLAESLEGICLQAWDLTKNWFSERRKHLNKDLIKTGGPFAPKSTGQAIRHEEGVLCGSLYVDGVSLKAGAFRYNRGSTSPVGSSGGSKDKGRP